MPSAPLYFPGSPEPDSIARRRFRALARSAPWLSTSLKVEIDIPDELGDPGRGLTGTVTAKIRQREGIAVHNAAGALVFQKETFSAQRSRDYVAATNASWKLPSTLITPVYTTDHLVLRRPEIAGFDGLLPLEYWAAVLDPVEIAGTEPAAQDLAFDHPTYIHELSEIMHEGRPALAAGAQFRAHISSGPCRFRAGSRWHAHAAGFGSGHRRLPSAPAAVRPRSSRT
ncbi:hypothetical protein AAHB37_04210 [Glutamicibacter halophytocola]|uniref:hypothetical protein n=1 Tax=Glutamicibacter halophytocola TaxID=1933880 RepID=UPI00321B3B1A